MMLTEKWLRLRAIRAAVTRKLEDARSAGEIGSSLQAEVELGVAAGDAALLRSLDDDLKYVFITSKAAVREAAVDEAEVAVKASGDAKCERCWHYRRDIGVSAKHPTICARCVSNLDGPGEVRRVDASGRITAVFGGLNDAARMAWTSGLAR